MAVGAFDDSGCIHRSFERALQYSLGDVMPLFPARTRIDGETGGRKNILPPPFACCIRKLAREGEREVDTAKAVFEILFVLRFDSQQVTVQRFTQIHWQHGDAVFPTFGIAHGDLCQCEIDVFHPVRYWLSRDLR